MSEAPGKYDLFSGMKRAKPLQLQYPVGAGLDIPSGMFMKGAHGQHMLLGGPGHVTGIVAQPNVFKSRLLRFFLMRIMQQFKGLTDDPVRALLMDTENLTKEHWLRIEAMQMGLDPEILFGHDFPLFFLTNAVEQDGTEYYDAWQKMINDKIKRNKRYVSPFLDRDGSFLKFLWPTPNGLDSISDFKDVKTLEAEKLALGDPKAQTMFLRAGLMKTRMLAAAGTLTHRGEAPLFMVAQVGTKFQMDTHAPAEVKLQYLKSLEIKGGGTKFIYATDTLLYVRKCMVLHDGSTERFPKWPRDAEYMEKIPGDTDLQYVEVEFLRNKQGPSGRVVPMLISQEQGILNALTQFAMMADQKYWGMETSGSGGQYYTTPWLPAKKMQRTRVRTQLETDPRLARAMEISSEQFQMYRFWSTLPSKFKVHPQKLTQVLKDRGYHLEELLDTAGAWPSMLDKNGTPFLSTMDLLNMYHGEYHPWWMKRKPTDAMVQVPASLDLKPSLDMMPGKADLGKSKALLGLDDVVTLTEDEEDGELSDEELRELGIVMEPA